MHHFLTSSVLPQIMWLYQCLNVLRKHLHADHVGKLMHLALYMQSLLDDFAQSNVETAATMVEAAGRFLYSLPETCVRMSNMLEVSTLLCCICI